MDRRAGGRVPGGREPVDWAPGAGVGGCGPAAPGRTCLSATPGLQAGCPDHSRRVPAHSRGRPEQQGEPLAPHATHPRGPRPPAALLAKPQFPRHGGGAGVNPSRKGGGQAPPSEMQERTPPSLPPSKRLRENVHVTRFPNACEAVRGLGPVSRPRADPGSGRLACGGGRTCGRARRGPTCEGGTLPSPGSVGGSPG